MFLCVPNKKPLTKLGVVTDSGAIVDPAQLTHIA